jgi:hypothetical protein
VVEAGARVRRSVVLPGGTVRRDRTFDGKVIGSDGEAVW